MSFLLTNPIMGRKRPQQILNLWHSTQHVVPVPRLTLL